MVECAGLAPHGTVNDVHLLRQQLIVELLRKSSMPIQDIQACLKTCIDKHILTLQVCSEVRKLIHDFGLNNEESPCQVLPCGADRTAALRATVEDIPMRSIFDAEFERLEVLGRGAFGEVWRCRNHVDQREYAVKAVPFEFDPDDGHLDHHSVREARVWAAVDHPNAIRYHAAWVEVSQTPSSYARSSPEVPCVIIKELSSNESLSPRHSTFTGSSIESRRFDNDGIFDRSDGSVAFEDSSDGIVFEASSVDSRETDVLNASGGFDRLVLQKVGSLVAVEGRSPLSLQLVAQQASRPTQKAKQRATLYLQTELVRGGTLQGWIDRRNSRAASGQGGDEGRAWVQQGQEIFKQLVSVVSALHSKGIVHRDIKPANVLLTEDRNVRLGDFGLAKQSGAHKTDLALASATSGPPDHTRGIGTPTYASPEQMQSGQYGSGADIYALGVILAELLCPVQTQMERAKLLEGVRASSGRGLPAIADAVRPGASSLVLRMTDADPESRPSASDLDSFLSGQVDLMSFPRSPRKNVRALEDQTLEFDRGHPHLLLGTVS